MNTQWMPERRHNWSFWNNVRRRSELVRLDTNGRQTGLGQVRWIREHRDVNGMVCHNGQKSTIGRRNDLSDLRVHGHIQDLVVH